MKNDILSAIDRGEAIAGMEPLAVGESNPQRGELVDRAFELARLAPAFKSSLPPSIVPSLSDLVRSMNCYYSNLIEGHNTHPVDIEKALRNDYSADPKRRDLQLEAKAHVSVQRWIDSGGIRNRPSDAQSLREIHRRFCAEIPDSLLRVTDPDSGRTATVIPGALRTQKVKMGKHVAISPGAVPRFLKRFEEKYGAMGPAESVLGAAAAHHRLLWIHPFVDGNGRVARLMSHATLLDALDTGGLWSIARGLARQASAYKDHLANCDAARRNDLDGRGALSEEALVAFTRFFLNACIDQVKFMQTLFQPDRLRARILVWAEEETRLGTLPAGSGAILESVLFRGELPKGDVATVIGKGSRQASRAVSVLTNRGLLVSESLRAPLRLAFKPELAGRWLPGLFPDQN